MFGSKASVHIAADADVFGVAGDLADMVDDFFKRERAFVEGDFPGIQPGEQHPSVEGDFDDGAPLDMRRADGRQNCMPLAPMSAPPFLFP